jgi:serine phosphatase RsbU (regulator of sigma subunit)
MNLNQKEELLKSLIISQQITEVELNELSTRVENLFKVEIENIYKKIKSLPLVYEKSDTFDNLLQLFYLLLGEWPLNIQQFDKHCHSCIITEAEVSEMSGRVHEEWIQEIKEKWLETDDSEPEYYEMVPFVDLSLTKQKLYYEFIYIIPIVFKKAGYEVIRKSEAQFINISIAEKLARVIHSAYQKSMLAKSGNLQVLYNNLYPDVSSKSIPDYDDLPESLKLSNLDNAYHLPTKLLSIAYKIQKVEGDEVEIPLLVLTDQEVETMARVEHDRWCWERRLAGWTYGKIRNNDKKHHNCLIPFDDLSQEEQEKDRVVIRLVPSLLKDIAYVAVPVAPELSESITYIKKEWGYISEIKTEFNLLKAQLNKNYAPLPLERITNIELLLRNVKDSFDAGKKVQQSFLPTIFEFKEYLPESFVLYKPKDIVCGDFYFIKKIDDTVILAAADCTGHGIPAAILTATCYNILDMAVRHENITRPSEILNFVIEQLSFIFQYSDKQSGNKFGMDITVCSLNLRSHKLRFSGFGNPLYYFSHGDFNQIKGINSLLDSRSIKEMLRTDEIQLCKGDTFYIFSDGYKDQFGSADNEKYNVKRFKLLLHDIQILSVAEQCDILNQTIESWRRSSDYHFVQTDDILIIGVKI